MHMGWLFWADRIEANIHPFCFPAKIDGGSLVDNFQGGTSGSKQQLHVSNGCEAPIDVNADRSRRLRKHACTKERK